MKVPKCKECFCLITSAFQNTRYYECEYNPYAIRRSISVDNLPRTSPKWCPARKENKKEADNE
jgi:hypothetical protein